MKKNVPVSHIMKTDVATINETTLFSAIRTTLEKSNFQHLPVVKSNKVIGIISSSDVLRVSYEDAFGGDDKGAKAILDHLLSIDYIMTKNVTCINANTSIRDAAETFVQHDFHALPVVDNNQALIGIVTPTDIIQYLLDQY